jgi:hypothetical protein
MTRERRRAAWPAAVVLGVTLAFSACEAGRLDAIDVSPGALTTGLMAHYTFDEGSGSVLVDHSGNKRNGTITGGTWIQDGKFGGALHFDGKSYATVPNFPDAPPSFSVSTWVRSTDTPDDAGYQTLASTEVVFDAGWQINVVKSPGAAYLQGGYWDDAINGYTYSNCTCLPNGVWTHMAFVVDSGMQTFTVYINGAVEHVAPAPGPIGPGTPSLSIGTWMEGGRFLVGDLDDMTIYGRALVAAEVMLLNQAPPPDVP